MDNTWLHSLCEKLKHTNKAIVHFDNISQSCPFSTLPQGPVLSHCCVLPGLFLYTDTMCVSVCPQNFCHAFLPAPGFVTVSQMVLTSSRWLMGYVFRLLLKCVLPGACSVQTCIRGDWVPLFLFTDYMTSGIFLLCTVGGSVIWLHRWWRFLEVCVWRLT